MKKFTLKKAVGVLLILLFLSGILTWYSNNLIKKTSEGKTFNKIEETPHVKVGLLLGTAKHVRNGNINQYYKYRIDAATALFDAGKINFVIISGDNGRETYDEPTDMKKGLIANGIDSTKIFLDYAGFRTFDSVVRAKEIFGKDSILLISQKFHNERAIFTAEKYGMTAFGFNAKGVGSRYGFKTAVREVFARVKVVIDFLIGTKPKFLGEKIEIK